MQHRRGDVQPAIENPETAASRDSFMSDSLLRLSPDVYGSSKAFGRWRKLAGDFLDPKDLVGLGPFCALDDVELDLVAFL